MELSKWLQNRDCAILTLQNRSKDSTITITSKGQITIPQEVRRRLGLKQGDLITFEVENGLTVLKPYRGETNPFTDYAGALGGFDTEEEVSAWLGDSRGCSH